MKGKRFLKRLLYFVGIIIILSLVAFVFRAPILRGTGQYLVCTDELKPSEVIFVLGGNSFDRGNEAAKLFNEGYGKRIVCLGENVYPSLKALSIEKSESEITEFNLVKNNGVSKRKVEVLKKGTSTKEEAEAISEYCETNGIESAIVVSDRFHTRRINGVFQPLFEEHRTQLIIHGSPSSLYDENLWWEKEEGLLMVNNEYVKLIYYWMKY